MKILIWWRGPSGYMRACVNHLVRGGHQVQLFSEGDQEAWGEVGSRATGSLEVVDRRIPVAGSLSPDLLLATMFGRVDFAVDAVRLSWRFPSCVRVGASDSPAKGSARQRYAARAGVLARYAFPNVFVPGTSQLDLMRQLSYPDERIHLGLYQADSDTFEFSSRGGLSRNAPFLFVGQLVPRKGLSLLVDAYRRYSSQIASPRPLLIVGALPPGLDQSGLMASGVEFLGWQSPEVIAKLMQESRALVHPAYEEHWGVVVQEAALCGLPTILSSSVGAGEIVEAVLPAPLASSDSIGLLERSLLLVDRLEDEAYLSLRKAMRSSVSAQTLDRWVQRVEELARC